MVSRSRLQAVRALLRSPAVGYLMPCLSTPFAVLGAPTLPPVMVVPAYRALLGELWLIQQPSWATRSKKAETLS